MIEITTRGAEVICKIKGHHPVSGWKYIFGFDAGSEDYALLLAENLRDAMDTKLHSMKQQHYEQGWSDQRKRKGKRIVFCTNWDVDR